MAAISSGLIVGAAAAFFAFLSVIVGLLEWRWEAIGTELERERKVNRLVPKEKLTVSYEEEELVDGGFDGHGLTSLASIGRSPFSQADKDPDYRFSLTDITVRCDGGLQKLWRGLEGETKLEVAVVRQALIAGEPGFPPDIDALDKFDPDAADVSIETPADGELVFSVQSVDEDVVLEVVEDLFQFIDENLAQEKLPWGWDRDGE